MPSGRSSRCCRACPRACPTEHAAALCQTSGTWRGVASARLNAFGPDRCRSPGKRRSRVRPGRPFSEPVRQSAGILPASPGRVFPCKLPCFPSQMRPVRSPYWSEARTIDSGWGFHPKLRRSIMKGWIHLLSGVAFAATVAHVATREAVRHSQRPASDGWKSHADPRRFVPRSPRRAARPSERTDAREAPQPNRDLLPASGVVATNDNPLSRLRRSGLI